MKALLILAGILMAAFVALALCSLEISIRNLCSLVDWSWVMVIGISVLIIATLTRREPKGKNII